MRTFYSVLWAAILLQSIVLFCPYAAQAEDSADLYIEDGKAVPLPPSLDPLRIMRVKRVVEKIYLLRENKTTFLGALGDPDSGNGPDVIALDINFDGEPEFLLREMGGNMQSEYFLVDSKGQRDLAGQLFPATTTEQGLAANRFELPDFNAKAKTISFRHRGGIAATTETYAFKNDRYYLVENTEPASATGNFLLEIRIVYGEKNGPQSRSLRLYGDTSNKAVRILLPEETFLYTNIVTTDQTGTRRSALLPKGTPATLLAIATDAEGDRWFLTLAARKRGWVREHNIFVSVIKPVTPQRIPGKKPLPQDPSFAPLQSLLILEQQRDANGELWLKLCNGIGLAGWIRQTELAPVAKD